MPPSDRAPAGDLTVVVPAFEEAAALPDTLRELDGVCAPRGWAVIVVDDGSSDDTGSIAAAAGATVIRHKVRRGYGAALKSGIRAAATPWVVTMDADGQHDPADLEALLLAAVQGDADLVVGDRGGRGSDAYRAAGKWLIRALTRILLSDSVRDLNSGIKLYRSELARRYLPLCPDSMAFSDVITLAFLWHRHLVLEHPVTVRPRRAGRSTISTQTAFDTLMEILNIATLFNPMRIFLPLSAAAWLAGVLWGIPFVLEGRGVSVGSMLAIVTGIILFALGLLAEQLAAIRKRQVKDAELA